MSTVPMPQPRAPVRVRAKYVAFAVVGLMIAYVLQHNEAFLLDPDDPAWSHYATIKWWLLPHGLAGALAIFLGITQFSTRLRARHLAVHRWVGRTYVALVLVAAPLGAYIQYVEEAMGMQRSFTLAAIVDACLWLLATGVAFWAIRGKRIDLHRQWMTRSFVMATVFLQVRVIAGVSGWEALGPMAIETIVWICVASAYPIADLALMMEDRLSRRELRRPPGAAERDAVRLPAG